MQPAQPAAWEMFLPFLFIMVIFYFLIIRPQGKKLKEHEKFVSELKRGEAVVTNSGILGTIDGITEQVITLEIANGVKMKILKKQIAGTQASLLKTDAKKDA